ncbi:MAG: hypothetical protein N2049_08450 [Anaerolineales bacterium]|nr:hypothetical protein [Anaerolineales bacterium]MCX7609229.1 hypothetical protein [Anaerolineales bacterium]MDW8226174.1 hypothetical protein [Anaerolineales bacterium]
MFSRPLTLEHALYLLALVLALGLRLLHLGVLPLSDVEAEWALQSLAIARGEHPAVGPNPAYVHLTALLFALFGASNFWARFWPALSGALLVLAPWFVRYRIGRLPALVLAFGLALDPALNALARQAGGPMLAVTFLLFALVFWLDGRRSLAGAAFGLALLSGSAVWFGLTVAALARGLEFLLLRTVGKTGEGAESEAEEAGVELDATRLSERWRPLIWGAVSFLTLGTLFLLSPSGLAGFADSFLVYLRGLWTLSDVPLGRILLALPAYEFLPLVIGAFALLRAVFHRASLSLRLGVWALAGLLWTVVYAGHQTADLVWFVFPVWALASLEIGRYFDFGGRNLWLVAAAWGLVFVLGVIFWLAQARLTTVDFANPAFRWQWVILILVPLIGATAVILLGYGWLMEEAFLGGMWGLLTILVLYTIGVTTGAAQIREPRTFELWYPEPRVGRLEVLLKVANELSVMNRGARAALPVTIVGVDSPALRWLFRDWSLKQTDVLDPMAMPELLITPAGSELALPTAYRGALFVWREMGNWYQLSLQLWFKWFVYRQLPVQQQDVVLWVRADLMLDSPTP